MLKKIFLVIIILIGYLLYARFVLSPGSLNNFSLIDDGQLIKYGRYLKECVVGRSCIGFKTEIIDSLPDVGLSRVGAWLIHGTLYQGSAINAAFQHTFRVYGLGLLMLALLVLSGLSAGVGNIGLLLGSAVFISNYSFTENIIRLGPIEPYMVIFLGIFSLLFLNLHRFSIKYRPLALFVALLTLIYFLLLKEAAIAILPVIIIIGLLFPKIFRKRHLIIISVVSASLYFLFRYLLHSSNMPFDYSQNYKFNIIFIIKNSWNYVNLLINSLNPFFSLLVITPFLFVNKKFRQKIVDYNLLYWLLVFVCFTVILFPWKFVYDRYLLPAIFSFSIFITIFIGRILDEIEKNLVLSKKTKILFHTLVVLITFNIFFVGVPSNLIKSINYRNWFGVFTQFEADQVKTIAKANDTVYLNAKNTIDNWEVTYEIPMHINYFYGAKPSISMFEENIPLSGYLFTRSSIEPVIGNDTTSISKYPIVDAGEYNIYQIDSVEFNKLFKFRPIEALQNPPMSDKNITYFWEIRKIK